jgi:hypothetical protein
MKIELLLSIPTLLLISCGGAIPFPYPQTAPIPPFSGRVHGWGSDGVRVEVQGHPETRTTADRNGNFVTREGSDFYFGMDQAYFSRDYRMTASTNGKISKSWSIERPPLIGRYEGQPDHGRPVGPVIFGNQPK